jgi:hypothetical protein
MTTVEDVERSRRVRLLGKMVFSALEGAQCGAEAIVTLTTVLGSLIRTAPDPEATFRGAADAIALTLTTPGGPAPPVSFVPGMDYHHVALAGADKADKERGLAITAACGRVQDALEGMRPADASMALSMMAGALIASAATDPMKVRTTMIQVIDGFIAQMGASAASTGGLPN